MRRLASALALAFLLVAPAGVFAQAEATSYEALTVSTTALPISTGVLTVAGRQASVCLLSVETAGIRMRFDGTAPTASEGHPVTAGTTLPLAGFSNLSRLRMIRSGSADASVRVTCLFGTPGTTESPVAVAFAGATGTQLDAANTSLDNLENKVVDGVVSVDVDFINGVAPLAAVAAGSLQSAATGTGPGNALTVNGYAWASGTINCSSCSGTTVVWEVSEDGTNYAAVEGAFQVSAEKTIASSTSTSGLTYWNIPVAGKQLLRARISAYSMGTVTVTARAVQASAQGTVYRQSDGTNLALVDPCTSETKSRTAISQTADTVIIAAAASKKNYICSILLVAAAAEIINIVEGTGTTCQTGTAAIVGSTTEANGLSLAANGGFPAVGGNATVIPGSGTNVDTCLYNSGTNRVSGFVTWVQR